MSTSNATLACYTGGFSQLRPMELGRSAGPGPQDLRVRQDILARPGCVTRPRRADVKPQSRARIERRKMERKKRKGEDPTKKGQKEEKKKENCKINSKRA